MARKRHTAEEIVTKLRQVDVLTAQGRLRHQGAGIAIGSIRSGPSFLELLTFVDTG